MLKYLRKLILARCGFDTPSFLRDPALAHLAESGDPKRLSWLLRHYEATWGGSASSAAKKPIDGDGSALPWYTYAAIEWIQQLDFRDAHVFEYGSGNSSRFWADRALRVNSVESSPEWHTIVSESLKENQSLWLKTNRREYTESILSADCNYHVVVVDGLYRYDCALVGAKCLRPGGMVVLDNSDWYPSTCAMLRGEGLIQVDFAGPGPVNPYAWCTSFFLTPNFSIPRADNEGPPSVRGGIAQISEYDQPQR